MKKSWRSVLGTHLVHIICPIFLPAAVAVLDFDFLISALARNLSSPVSTSGWLTVWKWWRWRLRYLCLYSDWLHDWEDVFEALARSTRRRRRVLFVTVGTFFYHFHLFSWWSSQIHWRSALIFHSFWRRSIEVRVDLRKMILKIQSRWRQLRAARCEKTFSITISSTTWSITVIISSERR